MDLAVGLGTPFQAQIEFLRTKLRLPSERWDDIQRQAHDRAFMVAGAAKADLVADLHQAVVDAASDGRGLEAFRRDFKAIVAKHGWTGWTGEGTREGEAWRTRVIYQTNMSTSYWAGRRAQMTDPDYLRLRPYWRYIHSDAVMHPRPHHLAWHGLTLRHDHPFWASHFPPNGWGCQCRVVTVSAREGQASAQAGLGEPPEGWDAPDVKTGAPVGIDKGFDYAPGSGLDTPLRRLVQDKLIRYPQAITRALTMDVNHYINASADVVGFVEGVLADSSRRDPLWLGFVENPQALGEVLGVDVNGFLVLVPADAPRHIQRHHEWDGGTQRPVTAADYQRLSSVLNAFDVIRLGEPESGRPRVVVTKLVDGETFRAVFEARTGKKNRALALVTLSVKTAR